MLIPNCFRVRESELVADPAKVLARCVARGEVALVAANGITASRGKEVAALVPIAPYRRLLELAGDVHGEPTGKDQPC